MSSSVAQSPFHTLEPAAGVPARASRQLPRRRSARAVCLLIVAGAPAIGGCSLSFPIAPLLPSDEVTGSASPVPFGQLLDEEDRRREKAALSTALDPQGDGSTVRWENGKSGAKGAITAVGRAYTADGKVCRAFLGDLSRDALHRAVQGTACAVAAGDWELREVKPFARKPEG